MFSQAPLAILGAALTLSLVSGGVAPSKSATPAAPTPIEIAVEDARFAVFERDLSEPSKYNSATAGQKLPKAFQVDTHHKVQLKFVVKDKKSGTPAIVHQAFVALVHADTQREVIYVAEADKSTKAYSFELDVKAHAKDFSGVSGRYALRLLLGDAAASKAVDWHLADVVLTVPEGQPPAAVPKSRQIGYERLPEISHLFREQDPRPPGVVSDAFAVACAAPALLLLVLWLRVGLNFGNVKFSLWALGFHVGLAAIFGLYALYWLKLNMFETLKYLALIGVPTFVCGNRLLHSFSAGGGAAKAKSE